MIPYGTKSCAARARNPMPKLFSFSPSPFPTFSHRHTFDYTDSMCSQDKQPSSAEILRWILDGSLLDDEEEVRASIFMFQASQVIKLIRVCMILTRTKLPNTETGRRFMPENKAVWSNLPTHHADPGLILNAALRFSTSLQSGKLLSWPKDMARRG